MERAYVKNGEPESIRGEEVAKNIDAKRSDFLTT